jgi:hypothetical protein
MDWMSTHEEVNENSLLVHMRIFSPSIAKEQELVAG